MTEERNQRVVRTGKVVSNKMEKTIVVAIERKVPHELYKKGMTQTIKFKAHDENNEFLQGDLVFIEECRPLAKTKSWRVTKLAEKSQAA